MSKTVPCPIKRFPGSVTFRDPMPFLGVVRWEEASKSIPSTGEAGERYTQIEKLLFPLILENVEKWELANVLPGVTVENFPNAAPGTSAESIHFLVAWLITEISNIYKGNESPDPNA